MYHFGILLDEQPKKIKKEDKKEQKFATSSVSKLIDRSSPIAAQRTPSRKPMEIETKDVQPKKIIVPAGHNPS